MKLKTKALTLAVASLAVLGFASAQTVNPEPGFVEPEEVEPNQTYNNQKFNAQIHELSGDGNTDWIFFRFPDRLNESISPNSVNSNISISSSKKLVDSDGDGVKESVRFGVSPDTGHPVTANVTLDISVTYPANFDTFTVDVVAQDSTYGNGTASLTVRNVNYDPTQNQDSTDQQDTEEDTTQDQTDQQTDSTDEQQDTTDQQTDQDQQYTENQTQQNRTEKQANRTEKAGNRTIGNRTEKGNQTGVPEELPPGSSNASEKAKEKAGPGKGDGVGEKKRTEPGKGNQTARRGPPAAVINKLQNLVSLLNGLF